MTSAGKGFPPGRWCFNPGRKRNARAIRLRLRLPARPGRAPVSAACRIGARSGGRARSAWQGRGPRGKRLRANRIEPGARHHPDRRGDRPCHLADDGVPRRQPPRVPPSRPGRAASLPAMLRSAGLRMVLRFCLRRDLAMLTSPAATHSHVQAAEAGSPCTFPLLREVRSRAGRPSAVAATRAGRRTGVSGRGRSCTAATAALPRVPVRRACRSPGKWPCGRSGR